ncbi:hypothetical protein [Protofrankia symbiont of Coriaria ruscifolia]|uniref:hypothetical protein n=1 Tax=Protofrankia symbiont of Coriaria ruscifolia TaxID=1306542 RepID=UPI001A941F4B|nr:hypothetical protein [Protofrankia symbiont of Coriaria ruscifolia]
MAVPSVLAWRALPAGLSTALAWDDVIVYSRFGGLEHSIRHGWVAAHIRQQDPDAGE